MAGKASSQLCTRWSACDSDTISFVFGSVVLTKNWGFR